MFWFENSQNFLILPFQCLSILLWKTGVLDEGDRHDEGPDRLIRIPLGLTTGGLVKTCPEKRNLAEDTPPLANHSASAQSIQLASAK